MSGRTVHGPGIFLTELLTRIHANYCVPIDRYDLFVDTIFKTKIDKTVTKGYRKHVLHRI